MPEAPDLEAIRGFLQRSVAGVTISSAAIHEPIVARFSRDQFNATLSGNTFEAFERRGKFLLARMRENGLLVVNPMLTGRFQYVLPALRQRAKTCATVSFANGMQLRYVDASLMGKLYLVTDATLDTVPQFAEMGPDVLSPELSEAEFKRRLRRHPGMIKNILTNHLFVAGVGNAYADEILFVARLHPYRKRTSLSEGEIERLYAAQGDVMRWAVPIVAQRMQHELTYDEWRGHLRVHNKGGEPCPDCGARISQITAGQRITSFCRHCQP